MSPFCTTLLFSLTHLCRTEPTPAASSEWVLTNVPDDPAVRQHFEIECAEQPGNLKALEHLRINLKPNAGSARSSGDAAPASSLSTSGWPSPPPPLWGSLALFRKIFLHPRSAFVTPRHMHPPYCRLFLLTWRSVRARRACACVRLRPRRAAVGPFACSFVPTFFIT